jgi:hypothetical protein
LSKELPHAIFNLQRQQAKPAQQDLQSLRARDDLAQILGQKLGTRAVLL